MVANGTASVSLDSSDPTVLQKIGKFLKQAGYLASAKALKHEIKEKKNFEQSRSHGSNLLLQQWKY
jgi:hypothetical protein